MLRNQFLPDCKAVPFRYYRLIQVAPCDQSLIDNQGHNLVAVFPCKSCDLATAQNPKSFGKGAAIFAKVAVKLQL